MFEMTEWDQSRFDAALKERLQFPGRTEAQIINTAAYWIGINAKAEMPFVPQQRIDSELGVIVNSVITKTGKVSTNKRRRLETATFGQGAARKAVPLVALIIAARANPNSNYNRLTHGRYQIAANPFKGVSREQGRRNMLALARRMMKARHSSTHFLLTGWLEAIRTLAPFAVNKLRRGGPPPMDGAKFDYGLADRGGATPAVEGSWQVFAMIENSTGMVGLNAVSFNEALWLYGAPALQHAIDIEASLMEEYNEKAYEKQNARFNEMAR